MSSSPSATAAYIMEDPRDGSRLEQKIDPDVWVQTYLEPHLFPGAQVLDACLTAARQDGKTIELS